MSELYLITGFLGAGKTTFLKQFVRIFSYSRMHIIVNEFGKEGVDGELIRELGITLDEINNGSIFCACRLDKFEEVLQKALKESPEVIIVEASGLSDPTNVKKILNQTDKFQNVEYKGCICLVDAMQFLKVYETAVVVKKQLNVSDLILLNKVDLATEEQAEKVRRVLKMHRPDIIVRETSYGKLEEKWIEDLKVHMEEEDIEIFQTADVTLRKYLLEIYEDISLESLRNFLEMILNDTFRIKGFVYLEKQWYLVNGVGNILYIEPCGAKETEKNMLVVLSGNGMPAKKAIRTAMEWYPKIVKKVL